MEKISEKSRKKGRALPYCIAAVASVIAIFVLVTTLYPKDTFIKKSYKSKYEVNADDYSKIYEVLKPYEYSPEKRSFGYTNGYKSADLAVNESVPDAAEAPEPTAGDDYSKTNVQIEGVDEADIVKTDGKFIYALNQNTNEVNIYKADGKNTKLINTISWQSEHIKHDDDCEVGRYMYCNEMFLFNDTLVLIMNEDTWTYALAAGNDAFAVDEDSVGSEKQSMRYYSQKNTTSIQFYDVKEPEKATLINTLSQDGMYNTSRIAGGILYTVSNYTVYEVREDLPESYIPEIINAKGETSLISSDCIVLQDDTANTYTVITATDFKNTDAFKSDLALLGYSTGLFASNDNILIYFNKYYDTNYNVEKTVASDGEESFKRTDKDTSFTAYETRNDAILYLVSMNGGNLEFVTKQKVDGYINDQFSIDEYKGYFRIVTTTDMYMSIEQSGDRATYNYMVNDNRYNSLFVLDDKLTLCGSITDIARGEMIKSARFMGDVGYFVTFRQTDPLFSVDLSKPDKPEIIGTLKIPGFSEYLQSYGDGMLFGFGSAADIMSGGVYGLKLSMFDITNPSDVKEIACTELEGLWSEASYNHKAILADAKKNLIGFPTYDGYMLYSYTKDGFEKLGSISFKNNWYYSGNDRGLYIGSYYYIVSPYEGRIAVIDLDTLELVKTI